MSSILLDPIASSLPSAHKPPLGKPRLIAVDARNFICGVLAPHSHEHLVDQRPLDTFLPQHVLARVNAFCDKHPRLRPLFVLDGSPFRGKAGALAQRTQRRRQALQEVERLVAQGRIVEARRKATHALHLPREAQEDVVAALQEAGYEVHQAPGEAEAQAAAWARAGHIAYVASHDRDALLYGAPRVMRDWPQSARYVDTHEVARSVGAYSWVHLMEAFVLAGATSYAPRLPGIENIRHALHVLRKEDFESVLKARPPLRPEPWLLAREEYLNPPAHPFPLHLHAWA